MSARSPITLYGRANSSNVQKALWLFEEIGLVVARVDLGGKFGGLDAPDYRALNPSGAIPTVRDGDLTLWESHAILRHYARAHPEAGLLPQDPAALARVDISLDFTLATLWPPLRRAYQAVERRGVARDALEVEEALAETAVVIGAVEAFLGGRDWIAGAAFSIADLSLAVVLARWRHLGCDLAPWPALDALFGRASARAGFRRHVIVGG